MLIDPSRVEVLIIEWSQLEKYARQLAITQPVFILLGLAKFYIKQYLSVNYV